MLKFTFVPALLAIGALAVAADTTIDLSGSTTNWDVLLRGAQFDTANDQQAQAADIELVGNATHGMMYTRYDDQGTTDEVDDEVGYRIRVAGSGSVNSLAFNSGYVFIGVDTNSNGVIDFFFGVTGKGSLDAQGIYVYSPGTGANNSPSTSTPSLPVKIESLTATSFSIVQVSATTDPIAGLDVDLNSDPNVISLKTVDCFVSFKVSFNLLKNALAAKGVVITSQTQLRFILATSANENSINSDASGYNGVTGFAVTFASQGVFSAPLSVSNILPTITSNGGGASASVSIAENTTAVTTVTATDANASDVLSYSIASGADAALFSINSTSGVLAFASAPDFENPADAGLNNIYNVTVQVSDGNGGTATQALAVTVTDVADSTDTTAPTVLSVLRQTPTAAITNADTVVFSVTFSETVSNVNASDFALSGTAGGTITGVSSVSGAVYQVTVGGIATAEGTLDLGFFAGQDITDLATNALTATTPAVAQGYVIDNTAPTVTSILRQTPASATTNADSVVFRLTFS